MAGAVSRWLGSVEDLPEIAQRLLRVQIEHDTAINVIGRYDSEETLFYCDPPYPHDSRGDSNAYKYEMTDDEHRELASVLHKAKGKVALSSYQCDLMDELYGDWQAIEGPTKLVHSVKQPRTEVLWVNYEISNLDKYRGGSKIEWQVLDEIGGVEIAVLDCLSFLRHFLHLFHRLRLEFLEAYQGFVLAEPESAVSQPLKEAFLALRQAAESLE